MHRYIQGEGEAVVAGVDLSDIPNYADGYRLLTLRAKLVTSATVANRWPHFQFVSPSGNVIHEIVPQAAQAASVTVTYNLVGGGGAAYEGSTAYDGVSSLTLPDLWFPHGTKIKTVTTSLDAADQWSDVYWSAEVGEQWEHLHLLAEIAGSIGG